MIKDCEDVSYGESLKEMRLLLMLENRRLSGNFITVYKQMKGVCLEDREGLNLVISKGLSQPQPCCDSQQWTRHSDDQLTTDPHR